MINYSNLDLEMRIEVRQYSVGSVANIYDIDSISPINVSRYINITYKVIES